MATDIKINLLPWREERREEKKREFLNVLVAVLLFAGIIIFGVDRYYNAEIDTQQARNSFLQGKIGELEDRIAEIKQLQQQRNLLLSRMQVIQQLQGNRPVIVRLFDELARQLADRVFFTSLEVKNSKLDIRGIAESNNRISSQLRNFAESDWFANPNVTEITADQVLRRSGRPLHPDGRPEFAEERGGGN
ncbi:MAG: PilN domain-containing protein [Gammaproteobacteria bacterium]|nr:PilN domain-containing protein [Gammaproteobacteria bacterium]